MAANFPEKIDRFIVQGLLGQGNQGVVYLAHDPDLDREVAIKAVNIRTGADSIDNLEQLMSEAKTVSRLQHPNVVSIFDIGLQDQSPYLVFEYIDGQSLQDLIGSGVKYEQKIEIIGDILAGVSAAHGQNIVHCDIKPANILINQQGQAKVTDFGLALLNGDSKNTDDVLYGTPQYMAPEYIESHRHRKVSDVFSLGLVFYELLTDTPAFKGEDVFQVLRAISNDRLISAAKLNHEIDEGLDAFLLNALEKNPTKRFSDAKVMLDAFNEYLSLDDTIANLSEDNDATAQFLLRRMRHKKDFPAFGHTLSILNNASSSETESLTEVSNAILNDYSLTNKLLRLVNSAHYSRGGRKISTISRAVVMLGINRVRSLATGLTLFEHMQNESHSKKVKEAAVSALFSGLIANALARNRRLPNHEEAFLSALLQQLGKMLMGFYLPEELQATENLMRQRKCSEESAAKQVLGTTYHQLGISVAREWGFPSFITDCMQPIDFENSEISIRTQGELRLISQFSNALSGCLAKPISQQAGEIQKLLGRYSEVLNLDSKQLSDLVESCGEELKLFARTINFDLGTNLLYQQLNSDKGLLFDSAKPKAKPASATNIDQSMKILTEENATSVRSIETLLAEGIQDITETLTGDFNLNRIMQMVLETIFRAFKDVRVVLCLKDARVGQIKARFGYGDDIERYIEHFSIPLNAPMDVFHIAFAKNVDIRIENTEEESIRNKIPRWFYQHFPVSSFTLFPIVIKNSPIALIYIDSSIETTFRPTDNQLGLLKTLRNQIILAIKSLN